MSPLVVLSFTLVYLVVVLGLRTLAHYRRTGSSGFRGVSGRPGSLEWWGGATFAVGVVLAVVAPLAHRLAPEGVGALVSARAPTWSVVLGWVLYGVGFVATYRSQSAMGSSWRIGVDDSEKTALVSCGAFAWVRNPIFTSMLLAGAGLFLLLPTYVSLLALGALFVAIELQVRFVEEPYLLRAHGEAYREYARKTGRFVPGLGRMR